MASATSSVRDLGKMFGLRGKYYSNIDVPDIIGSQLGHDITWFQDRFPGLYAALNGSGWSASDMLGLTYFSACINEVGFIGNSGYYQSREKVKIPVGKWFYNTEMRIGQGIVEGCGPFLYGGQGGTELKRLPTNWKSLYGPQNDNTFSGFCPWNYCGEMGLTGNPIGVSGGNEYAHSCLIKDLCMTGLAGDGGFNDPSIREVGYQYWNAGENSGYDNCHFNNFNDFGVLITGRPAHADTGKVSSFFRNKVAGTGIRGCAIGVLNLKHSGDFNPYAFYGFRQGETLSAPNALTHQVTTTANYTQPNYALASPANQVNITLSDASELQIGHRIYVVGGGHYDILNVVGNVVTVKQLIVAGAPSGFNSATGTVISSGAVVYLPFWPCCLDDAPGGNISVDFVKIEAYACRSGYAGYSSCYPDIPGKGQMLARLTGMFKFWVKGGQSFVHDGFVNSLVRVVDDKLDNGYGQLLNGSEVSLSMGTIGFKHWLHYATGNVKFVNPDTYQQSGEFYWCANVGSGLTARNPSTQAAWTPVTATYKGLQPYSNGNGVPAWNENAYPTFGYDTVTGQDW